MVVSFYICLFRKNACHKNAIILWKVFLFVVVLFLFVACTYYRFINMMMIFMQNGQSHQIFTSWQSMLNGTKVTGS